MNSRATICRTIGIVNAGGIGIGVAGLYQTAMDDTLPDRLSTDPKSPYYNGPLLERGVGIKFNGAEKTNVDEYCVSEGWVRVVAGKTMDRHGRPLTIKLKGTVEPYIREPG